MSVTSGIKHRDDTLCTARKYLLIEITNIPVYFHTGI